MLCDEDLTIDKEKFAKLMRTNQDETNRVYRYYWFCLSLCFVNFVLSSLFYSFSMFLIFFYSS